MNHDVSILTIENVFCREEQVWARNASKTRYYDAVVFFAEGEIEYIFPHRSVVAKKGDILFLPGNLPYSGRRHSEYCTYYVIDFLCLEEGQFENFGAPCAFAAGNYQRVLQRFERALDLWNRSSIDTMLGVKELLYALLRERFSGKEESGDPMIRNHILRYIEKHMCDPNLNVARICKALYISDSQLRKTIYKLTGVSPIEYITMRRVNKAKVMLSASGETIKNISYACGFTSPYYFSRVFSKMTGMSPSVYRAFTTD